MKINKDEIEKYFSLNEEIYSGGKRKKFKILEICDNRIRIKPTDANTKSRLRYDKLSIVIDNYEKVDPMRIEITVGNILKDNNLIDTQNESYLYGMAREYLKKQNCITEEKLKYELEKEIVASIKINDIERIERLKIAPIKPEEVYILSKAYKRNPDVIVEVLKRANGVCEKCKSAAPFIKAKDNAPYLEIHHKVWLSKGGDDTVANTVALCPNCHRKAHYGINA